MTRKTYPSDLSDAEWQYLEPLLPASNGIGCPRQVDLREILNAIFVSSGQREQVACYAA